MPNPKQCRGVSTLAHNRTSVQDLWAMARKPEPEVQRRGAAWRRGGKRGLITYPTDRLLGVADTKEAADAAVAALKAAGFWEDDISVVSPAGASEGLKRLGPRRGPLAPIIRLVQFAMMDQTPDFAVYEAALADGRLIVAVRVADRDRLRYAAAAMQSAGLHFLNFYGRWSTADIAPWRGPELPLPEHLRR
jgi:hypothetical protein